MSEKNVDRRQALKRGLELTAGMAGLAAVGEWTAKEAKVKKEGINTPLGTFYPLYEKHDVEKNINGVPRPLDGYFRESLPQWEYNSSRRLRTFRGKTFFGAFFTGELSDQPAYPIDLLEKLAKDGTPIILGGIDIPDIWYMRQQFLFNSFLEATKTTLGLSAIGASIVDKKPTRRQFLESAAIWTSWILTTTPWLARAPAGAAIVLDPEQKAPISRILTRLHALVNHLTPEDVTIFFRNLIMANNLLLATKTIKEWKKTLPKIAFNVGVMHAGIEDFLRVGPAFIRWLIDLYPKEYLEKIIDHNGGLENFCSVRILTLPKDFTGKKEDYDRIIDQKVTDERLFKMLQQKLPEYWAKESAEKKDSIR